MQFQAQHDEGRRDSTSSLIIPDLRIFGDVSVGHMGGRSQSLPALPALSPSGAVSMADLNPIQKRSISIQGNAKDPDSRGIWRPSIGRESIRKGGHDIEVKNSVKVDYDQAFDDDGHVLRTGANPKPRGTRSCAAAGSHASWGQAELALRCRVRQYTCSLQPRKRRHAVVANCGSRTVCCTTVLSQV